jgi:cobalamin biosynthesis Mg chelatase CobN
MANREDLEQDERELCNLYRNMLRADQLMLLRLARTRAGKYGAHANKGASAEDAADKEGDLGTSLTRLRIAPNNCGVVYFLN